MLIQKKLHIEFITQWNYDKNNVGFLNTVHGRSVYGSVWIGFG